ncbi:MAG TPA: MFS transporter [Gaiellales bacterium]|nr:MFS transporter [Gaiellales bacterium]
MLERRWWTLVIVCSGIFMLLLDITVVNIALPDMARDLGASFSDLQWVIDAYALSLAALMLTAGSIGDLAGHRLTFAAGLVVFSLSSLGCGLAQDPSLLIAARAVQGVGGAALFATSLALLAQEFHGRDRGIALGAWGATAGAAIALGPLVGGALTSGVGWRWVFLVNVPIGALALLATVARVRETERRPGVRPDWWGFAAMAGAMTGIVYGLIRGNVDGWTSASIVGAFAAGAALLLAFVVIELRGRHPMLDLAVFRSPSIVGASVGAVAIASTLFSMFLYLTLYLQDILRYSAFDTGLRFLPVSALVLLVAPISGRVTQHVPPRYLVGGGLGLVAVGLATMTRVDPQSGWTVLLPGFILGGIGSGLLNPALASTAIGTVRREAAGIGSGINNTFRQLGIAIGIAGLGALFQSRVHDAVVSGLTARGPRLGARAGEIADAITQGGGLQAVGSGSGGSSPTQRVIADVARSAFITGLDRILWVAAAGALCGAVLTVVLIRPADFHGSPEQMQAGQRGRFGRPRSSRRDRLPRRPGART